MPTPGRLALLAAALLGGCATQSTRLDHTALPSVAQPTAPAAAVPAPSSAADTAADTPAKSANDAADDTANDTTSDGNDGNADDVEAAEASLSLPPAHAVSSGGESIWPVLRQGFRLKVADQRAVAQQIAWFRRHPDYLTRTLDRGDRYIYYIVQQLKARDMPTEIALLPVVESAYHPFAYSNGRAAGLWQFIPGTGRRFGLKQNWWYDGRRDVIASTKAALDYLEYLHGVFNGDWLLALAAYNSGSGTVRYAIRKNRRHRRPTDFWHLDLPRETRNYVPKLLALSAVVADPSAYGLSLPAVPNKPQFAVVDTGGQLDLALAADLAGVAVEELYWLNPGCNQWSTAPKGPNRLLVPIDHAEAFKTKLAALPARKRIHWIRHKIRSGEALLTIARHYHTTVAMIRNVNGLHGNTIRAGHHLMIPVAAKSLDKYTLSAKQRLLARQSRRHRGKGRITVVVRSGDSFWTIARHYGVHTGQLAKWNGMAPRDTLHIGQKLVVWVGSRHHSRTVASSARIRTVHYTVRRGDSVARISQRFRVNVSDVLRWNGIDRGDYLQPGQRLTLYVDVTRQSGV
jgi:peptidoglycan lytic transglycosylase D